MSGNRRLLTPHIPNALKAELEPMNAARIFLFSGLRRTLSSVYVSANQFKALQWRSSISFRSGRRKIVGEFSFSPL
jgi:hypothetical protein